MLRSQQLISANSRLRFCVVGLCLVVILGPSIAIGVRSDTALAFILGLAALLAIAASVRGSFLACSADSEERTFIKRNYWRVLGLLIFLSTIHYLLLLVANWKDRPGFLYDDEPLYDSIGLMIAENWRSGVWFAIPWRFDATFSPDVKAGILFPWVVGVNYYIFGHLAILVRFLNALFGLWMATALYGISRSLFPDDVRVRELAFWLVAFLPIVLTWTVSQTRDIQLAACSVIALWALIGLLNGFRLWPVCMGCAAFAWLYFLRPFSAFLLILAATPGIVMHLARTSERDALHSMRNRIIPATLVILIVLAAPIAASEFFFKASQYGVEDTLALDNSASFDASALSAVLSILQPSPFSVFKEFSFYLQYQFVLGISWYVLLPLWVWGGMALLRRLHRDRVIILSFTIVTMILSMFSTVTAFGDPMRARVPALPFLVLFGAWALAQAKSKDRTRERLLGFCLITYLLLLVSGAYDLLNSFVPAPVLAIVLPLPLVPLGIILRYRSYLFTGRWSVRHPSFTPSPDERTSP